MIHPQDHPQIQYALEHGDFEIEGQFMWGSNYTFLCELIHESKRIECVYKPTRGERPLWDFPEESLASREMAAYLVSEAAGWYFVPPTAYRKDGPHGPGSLQLFIGHDPNVHYFTFTQEQKQALRSAVLFDAAINNTDRKGGHLILGEGNKIWLIDHGVCFHTEPKLRTVIWDFAGETIQAEQAAPLAQLANALLPEGKLRQELARHLSQKEIEAFSLRVTHLLSQNQFPIPDENRISYPWPPV